MDFNQDWKFKLQDETSGHLLELDDSSYETVQLPHDYSIPQGYNQEEGDGCTGYMLGGIAWYRKKFQSTEAMKNGQVYVYFDGIYNRSNLYFNETFLKFHPYGYSPILLDVTDYLKEETNILSVRVDHSRYADSRWYTGSGIYRKAELLVLPHCHIHPYGVKIHTPEVNNKEATVEIAVDVINLEDKVSWEIKIFNPFGEEVCKQETNEKTTKIAIKKPVLWKIHEGKQYKAEISLKKEGVTLQKRTESFGIRYFHFDTNTGFYFNGQNLRIKGVCLHHDAGLVGAAVPLDMWKRRLEALKDCGCNGIRTAHNPFSKDFLSLCDEMGFLVQEEFYDEWDFPKDKRYNMKEVKVDYITRGHHEFFQTYAKDDLQAVVHRDFNHPCIFQWSIGNEIEWTYPKYTLATGYFDANAGGNYFWSEPPYSVDEIRENVSKLPKEQWEVGETACKLVEWTKDLDGSRPVTANQILPSASYESGYSDVLDMVGFSYRQVVYDRIHEYYPEKPIMGTENLGQWHEWKAVLERPFISGIFLWTGINYIGESGNTDVWPRKATNSGLLDTAGFKKPSYDMFKSLWKEEETVAIYSQTLDKSMYTLDSTGNLVYKEGISWERRLWAWQEVNNHWNYTEGENVVIEVYSNCETVTLWLNEKEISTKCLKDFPDHIYKWVLPFQKGEIKATGVMEEAKLVTAAESCTMVLTCDKTKISRNPDEVIHVEACLLDETGKFVSHDEAEIEFLVTGSCRIFGVDNGSPDFVGKHNALKIKTHHGKALLVLGGNEITTVTIRGKMMENISNILSITVD